MSGKRFRLWAVLFIFVMATSAVQGQDDPAKPKNAKPQANGKAPVGVDTRGMYESALTVWKGRLKKLRDLRVEYATNTDKEKLTGIEQAWRIEVEEIEAMLPELIRNAQAAYVEAPNADPQLTQFLVKVVEDAYKRDDMETIFHVGDVLITNDADQKNLYEMVGYARIRAR